MIYQRYFANNSVTVNLKNGVLKEIPYHIFNDMVFQWQKEKRELDKIFDCRYVNSESSLYNKLQDRLGFFRKELEKKYENIISEWKEN